MQTLQQGQLVTIASVSAKFTHIAAFRGIQESARYRIPFATQQLKEITGTNA